MQTIFCFYRIIIMMSSISPKMFASLVKRLFHKNYQRIYENIRIISLITMQPNIYPLLYDKNISGVKETVLSFSSLIALNSLD